MSKTKKLSQYNGSAWSTPIDIGADAANVDYPTTTQGVTKNLTEVIGNVATGDSPLQTQISTKLSSTGAIDNTVLNQGPDTTTYPVTGTNVSDGSLAVTANNSSRSLWSKFNAFRARLINRIATFVDADMSDTSDVTIAATIDADTLDGTLGSTIKGDIQSNTAAIAELNDSLNNQFNITKGVATTNSYVTNGRCYWAKDKNSIFIEIYDMKFTSDANNHTVGNLGTTVGMASSYVPIPLLVGSKGFLDALRVDRQGNLVFQQGGTNTYGEYHGGAMAFTTKY